jgi:hypothetical protein
VPLRPPAFELVLTHLVLTAGLLAARAAYGSGDPSGLQYLFLQVAAVFVIIAGLLALFIRGQGLRVPRSAALLIAGALLVATFPYLVGLGLDSSRIDPIGYWAATLLLAAQAATAGWSLYHLLRAAT